MELRLEKVITAVEQISDSQNLDYNNPILLSLRHPLYNAELVQPPHITDLYRVAISSEEPQHLGLPLNAIWFVTRPENKYFRQALKLLSYEAPSQSAGHVTDAGLQLSWIVIDRYDRMFDERQIDTGMGEMGPPGEDGDPGIVFSDVQPVEPIWGVSFLEDGGTSVYYESGDDGTMRLSDPGEAEQPDENRIDSDILDVLGWPNQPNT